MSSEPRNRPQPQRTQRGEAATEGRLQPQRHEGTKKNSPTTNYTNERPIEASCRCDFTRIGEELPDAAMAQAPSYLKATRLKRGLLINFNELRLVDGIKRIAL